LQGNTGKLTPCRKYKIVAINCNLNFPAIGVDLAGILGDACMASAKGGLVPSWVRYGEGMEKGIPSIAD